MNDDLTLRASRYLDSDVTPEERALIEADPDVLAEVDRLRQVRAVLSDTEPAPLSVRERHLAAALDVWDRLPAAERSGALRDVTPADGAAAAGAASITATRSVRERRAKRGNSRILAIAAGLVVVLGGGLVVRNLSTTDSGTDQSVADAPIEADAELDERATLEEAAAAETFGDEDDIAEEVFAEPLEESASLGEGVSGGPESAPLDEDLEVLESDADLAIFAADVLGAPIAADAAPAEDGGDEPAAEEEPAAPASEADAAEDLAPTDTVFDLCGLVDVVVGPAIWDAGGLFEDVVLVGIDNATNEAIAYLEADCSIVARTPMPTP